MGLTGVVVFLVCMLTPILTFGGENILAIFALSAVNKLIALITWPFVFVGLCGIGYILWNHSWIFESQKVTITLFLLMVLLAFITSISIPQVILFRYPPIVHIIQTITSIIGGGRYFTMRWPTVLFAVLSVPILWKLIPGKKINKWGSNHRHTDNPYWLVLSCNIAPGCWTDVFLG